ncbi:MAG: CDP-alcohol phosphatidyltransferase family protein [Acutalibacteraceae bacterium]|jgi:cardiolipin synthase
MAHRIRMQWSIPNVLSLVRIALVPAFVVLYIRGIQPDQRALQYWSFGVLALSGVTDLLDGFIARHFHQITELGKVLDPIADKLTQVAVLVCLAVHYPLLIGLMILCVCKELGQMIGGMIILKLGGRVEGAKWYGKVSTFAFYLVMAAFVLWGEKMPAGVSIPLIVAVGVLMVYAFIRYAVAFGKTVRELKTKE